MLHEKTDLKKVFVAVIPKEGLATQRMGGALSMTLTIKYYSTAFIDYIL